MRNEKITTIVCHSEEKQVAMEMKRKFFILISF